MIRWINTIDDGNAPPIAEEIEEAANHMLRERDPTHSKPLGRNWVYRFLKRIPPRNKLNWIVQKPKEKRRIDAENIGMLTTWYDRFEQYIRVHKLGPKQIYNMDETGYQIGQGKPQRVITKNQTAYTPNGGLHELLITSIECVAADGWKMSPWFLVKGQYHVENWYRTTSLPPDYTIAPTQTGYTSNVIAIQWLHSFVMKTKS